MLRTMLMMICIVACALCIAMIAWHTSRNVQMLRTWKRTPGVITGTADDRTVEVSIGPLEDAKRINVPVRSGSIYSNWDHVTVLENPDHTSQWQLTGLMDLWQPVLAAAVGAVLLTISTMIAKSMPPARAEWRAGEWKATSTTNVGSPIVELRPPGQAWKANLLWAGILGGSLLAVAVFSSGTNLIARVLICWLGSNFVVWMTYSAVGNYTGAITADRNGVVLQSYWTTQRVTWNELRDVRLVDTKKDLEKLKGFGARGKMKPVDNFVPDIRHWAFYDTGLREVFRIDVASEPAAQVQALLGLARQQIARPIRTGDH